MKTLLKAIVLVIFVSIFCFSQNTYVSKARNFVAENGKALYQKGTTALSNSKVGFLADIGKGIK